MGKFFFLSDTESPKRWWSYPLTILLVLSGIIGFGFLPFQLALSMKGIAIDGSAKLSENDLNALFTNNEQLIYNLCPFLVGFLFLLAAFRFIHRRPAIRYFTSREKFDLKRFLVAFAIWGSMLTLFFIIDYASGAGNIRWNYQPESFFMLLLICLFLVPLQTGFEELLCRGYVLQWVGRATTRGIIVILVNGLIFGGLHTLNPEVSKLGAFAMTFYIVSGIFAAFLTLMDDGIELSWGYHTANNFMGLLIISNTWQALPTDSLFIDTSEPTAMGPELLITLLICYPLMALALAKIYRWNGWKQRLLGK